MRQHDLVLVAVVDDRLSVLRCCNDPETEVDCREELSAEKKDSQAPSWTVD